MDNIKRRIQLNATSAVAQVVFNALVYFILYKYLIITVGIKLLGIWSLILSFSSIANLANLGLTSGLVKFIAEYIALNQKDKLGKLIFTSLISLAILFSILSIIILLGAKYLLHFVVDVQFIPIALSILPYSLGSLSVNAIAGVFTSVLEGFQKNYLRNLIYIFSSILMLTFTIMLTPHLNLLGVAIAQLLQAIFIFIIAFVLISKIDYYNRFLHWKWSLSSFKELFNYGYKFQFASICSLFYEPTTKFLLSKFGGLSMVGYYEMASRLVNQVRAIVVNANQVIIPVVTETSIKGIKYLNNIYNKTFTITVNTSIPLMIGLIITTPIISKILIGHFEPIFIIITFILSISNLINIFCAPAYFGFLGLGIINPIFKVNFLMAIINAALSFVLGNIFNGYGVVLAWGITYIIGSIFLIIFYQNLNKFKRPHINNKIALSALLFLIIYILLNIICSSLNKNKFGSISIIYFIIFIAVFSKLLIKKEYIKTIIHKLKK